MTNAQNKNRNAVPDDVAEPDSDKDLEERSYYYDDAHGYEDFDPEEPDEDESE